MVSPEFSSAGSLTTYTWDGENRLIKIEWADGVLTMTYDADGLRRKKEDGSATANFLWDGQKVLLETDGQGSTVAQYALSTGVYGDLLSQRRSGASSFYHFDALGSTDRLTGADQGVTDSYTYYAFGEERASSGTTTNPYRYVGRLGYYRNGSDLVYLRARYYAPTTGRFVSRDPIVSATRRYRYTSNTPTTRMDPSGLWSCVEECWDVFGKDPKEALKDLVKKAVEKCKGPCFAVKPEQPGEEQESCWECIHSVLGGKLTDAVRQRICEFLACCWQEKKKPPKDTNLNCQDACDQEWFLCMCTRVTKARTGVNIVSAITRCFHDQQKCYCDCPGI